MNIKFNLTKNKKNYKVSVRVYYKNFDVSLNLDLFAFSDEEWDFSCETFRDNPEANEKLLELKSTILKRYNRDFTRGILINKSWLQEIVKEVFDRPTNEVALINNDKDIYIVDFSNYWLKTFADSWKTSPKETMSKLVKSQYQKFVDIFSYFQEQKKVRYTLYGLTQDDVYEFVNALEEDDYNSATIERFVARLKFMLNRAADMSLKVSQVRNQRIYIDKENDLSDKPYLTEEEINKIIKTDFSFDSELEIAKQNYIILLFTGLRGSDALKKLDITNIEDEFIKIKTSKTGQYVVLPLHSEVKKVIKNNFGNLPPKMSLYDFNIAIKKIAQICDIDQQIRGKLWDSEKKRKVIGVYKKYQLLSSHSCRRGFVTLYKDVISQEAICSILGWSNSEMIKIYNQTSKEDYAKELSKVWSNKK